jgi:hypothetical protein
VVKKVWLLLGIAIGFVLGSRAGRAPYERLRQSAQDLSGRPEVKDTVASVTTSVTQVKDQVVAKALHRQEEPTLGEIPLDNQME